MKKRESLKAVVTPKRIGRADEDNDYQDGVNDARDGSVDGSRIDTDSEEDKTDRNNW